ncbi:alpha/beta hydrolase [Amorphus sp. 3PC139-8]|uniref:alpha/beta hydrolase n=1 Tax=Amorphus sp. 3PC139-8 TaxID=2735676 RepID=UPI00345C993A
MLNLPSAVDAQLEAEYALRRRHPERSEVYDLHRRKSAAVRADGRWQLDVRYGAGPRCLLDVFPAGPAGGPVLFFVHGGYWRALDKSYVSFLVPPFVAAGITVVLPTYDLVPDVPVGSIVDELRLALAYVVENLAPSSVVVGGHSAGGQLAAMLALDDAERGGGPISGLVGVSGAYDLRPLLRTSINVDLRLTEEEAARQSPLVRLGTLPSTAPLVPLLAAVGSEETRGFRAWSAELVEGWRARGAEAHLMEPDGRTHFTVLDAIAEPDGALAKAIIALAGV